MFRGFLMCLGGIILAQTAWAVTPQAFVEALVAEYRSMKPGKSGELSAADVEHNKGVRKTLLSHLDTDELGRRSLEKHWESLEAEQRSEFLELLSTLIEERSLESIRGTSEFFEVEYDDVEKLEAGHALVRTTLFVKNDEFYADFKLQPEDETWSIYDVIIDDVSTVRNYKDQFNKIIAEHGFNELLRRMRDNVLEDPTPKTDKSGAG